MTKRTVPEKTIVICDVCGKESPKRAKKAQLILKRHALDHHGCAVADGTVKFDLCDECEDLISEAINKAVANFRREEKKRGKGQT